MQSDPVLAQVTVTTLTGDVEAVNPGTALTAPKMLTAVAPVEAPVDHVSPWARMTPFKRIAAVLRLEVERTVILSVPRIPTSGCVETTVIVFVETCPSVNVDALGLALE